MAVSQVGLSQFWYSDFGVFTIRNDAHQWQSMDKFGHIMSAYQVTRANSQLCRIAGLSAKKSKRWSALSTGIFFTGIEVMDGFSSDYGFSWPDFGANALGVGLAMLPESAQERFSLRISFHQTQFAPYRPEILGKSALEQFFKDYNGQTYWLSFWQEKEDKWYHALGFSLGVGASGMLGGTFNPSVNEAGQSLPSFERKRELALALDLNLAKLAVGHPKLQSWLRLLDFVKIPLPTLLWREGAKPVFRGFYY